MKAKLINDNHSYQIYGKLNKTLSKNNIYEYRIIKLPNSFLYQVDDPISNQFEFFTKEEFYNYSSNKEK